MPTDIDIAWAAGLFEGEGTLHLARHGKSTVPRYPQVSLGMCDLDVVERFMAVVGVGPIRKQDRSHLPNHQDCYYWVCENGRDCAAVIDMLIPFFGARRSKRAAEVLARAQSIGAVGSQGRSKYQTHCKRGHKFTEENTIRQSNAMSPKGWTRACRQCARERSLARHPNARALDWN